MFYGNLDRESLEEGKLLNGLKNFLKYKGKKEKDNIQYVKHPMFTTDIKIFDLNVVLFSDDNKKTKKELEEYYKGIKDKLSSDAKLINKNKDNLLNKIADKYMKAIKKYKLEDAYKLSAEEIKNSIKFMYHVKYIPEFGSYLFATDTNIKSINDDYLFCDTGATITKDNKVNFEVYVYQ